MSDQILTSTNYIILRYINQFQNFKGLRTIGDILNCFDQQLNSPHFHTTILTLIMQEFLIPAENASAIFYRWETEIKKDIRTFAPYALYCFRVRFLFYISLNNKIISSRATNWLDLEYCYYLPFCRVFFSNDKFHDSIVPYLIDKSQSYYTGKEIKADLQKIIKIEENCGEDELRKLEREPPLDDDLLIYQIWSKMIPKWPLLNTWIPSEDELKMMNDTIRNFRNARPL